MKKVVALIVLFVAFFATLNTTEVLVAQGFQFDPLGFYANQARQQQAQKQQAAIIAAVCGGVGIILFLLGIHLYIKDRDKKQREWQEKRDAEMKQALASNFRENSSSDTSDKDKPDN